MKPDRRAIGFRAHSGWATAVVVAGSPAGPVIVARRRIGTADPSITGSRQPFHAAERLPYEQAEALVLRCRASSTALAQTAVRALVGTHRITTAALLCGSGRPLPGLAAILKSHALIHTAEGELFRDVLIEAIRHCGLPLEKIKEKEAWSLATPALRNQIEKLKKQVGAPWTEDEKLATLAAWLALTQP
jgi:hypothetical protein